MILAVINQSFEKFQDDSKSRAESKFESSLKIIVTESSNSDLQYDLKKSNILVYSKEKFDDNSPSPKILKKNSSRRGLQKMIESKYYLATLTLAIIMNTIFLALDHYPMSKSFGNMLTYSNYAFTVFFFLEMLVKIIAYKPSKYIKDKMNIFDTFLVISSIVEIVASYLLSLDRNNNLSGISALAGLRTFRLFRMFKIMRAWSDLKNMISALIESLISLKFFSVLLAIFMVIASLLGNELFAYRVRFTTDGQVASNL